MDWTFLKVNGEPASMALWQWLYLFNFALATCGLCFGLVYGDPKGQYLIDSGNSRWITFPLGLAAIVGYLYVSLPYGLFAAIWLHSLLAQAGAPIGAIFISAGWTVGAWALMAIHLSLQHSRA